MMLGREVPRAAEGSAIPSIGDRSTEAGYAKASLIARGLVLWVNAPRTATRSALIVSGFGSRTVARSGFLVVLGSMTVRGSLLFFLSSSFPRFLPPSRAAEQELVVPRDRIKATRKFGPSRCHSSTSRQLAIPLLTTGKIVRAGVHLGHGTKGARAKERSSRWN